MDRRRLALVPLCLLALLSAGCLRLHAKTTPELPPLDVPAPPPRSIDTAESEPLPGTVVDAPISAPAPPARPRPTTPATRDAGRSEPPKPEPAAGPDIAPPEPPKATAGTTLQTTPPEREAELEKTIRELLGRAAANLNRVDYRRLNADARLQYDQAKRFAEQAEEAVHAKNLVYAHNLADKAATLAAQLAGR
jgi:hypothetical protein